VATTVGTPPMNLIPVRIDRESATLTLRSSTFSLVAALDASVDALAAQAGSDLQFGVRPEDIRVGGDDVVETYLLYSNSHDGSQPIDIRLTTVRVVCRNTLSFALNGHTARAFRWRHRDDPAVVEREARAFLQLATDQVRESQKVMSSLAARPCDDEAFRRFLTALMPDPAPPAGVNTSSAAARSFETRRASGLPRNFFSGAELKTIELRRCRRSDNDGFMRS